MIHHLLFPALSPTMTEGTLVAWRIKDGDAVKAGQVIAEIQTDKAVVEWESAESGTVAAILTPAASLVQVNMVAALLRTKADDDVAAALAKAQQANATLATAAKAAGDPAPAASAAAPAPAPAAPPTSHLPPPTGGPAKPARTWRVTPVAARLAAQHGLDLGRIAGSGPDGRIVRRDVEAAIASGAAKPVAAHAVRAEKPRLAVLRPDRAQPVTEVPLSPMRQVIAKRLTEAKQQIPHFQATVVADAAPLTAAREQANQLDGVRLTVNDFVVRACALALRVHPRLNATWAGTAVRQHDSADICVAVAIPDGLITPIVARAHAKSVRQLGEEVRVLAKKAVDGKLLPAEFQGGTFTISNLGMFGVASFNAIVNPPQVAILAVAGILDVPVVRGGQVVPGRTMALTLSCDHRAVDGADAAAFLKTLRELLENPAALLV